MAEMMYTANEFKAGRWCNSFPVRDVDDLHAIIAVTIKYAGDTAPDCWNMETKAGTVLEVIRASAHADANRSQGDRADVRELAAESL